MNFQPLSSRVWPRCRQMPRNGTNSALSAAKQLATLRHINNFLSQIFWEQTNAHRTPIGDRKVGKTSSRSLRNRKKNTINIRSKSHWQSFKFRFDWISRCKAKENFETFAFCCFAALFVVVLFVVFSGASLGVLSVCVRVCA